MHGWRVLGAALKGAECCHLGRFYMFMYQEHQSALLIWINICNCQCQSSKY